MRYGRTDVRTSCFPKCLRTQREKSIKYHKFIVCMCVCVYVWDSAVVYHIKEYNNSCVIMKLGFTTDGRCSITEIGCTICTPVCTLIFSFGRLLLSLRHSLVLSFSVSLVARSSIASLNLIPKNIHSASPVKRFHARFFPGYLMMHQKVDRKTTQTKSLHSKSTEWRATQNQILLHLRIKRVEHIQWCAHSKLSHLGLSSSCFFFSLSFSFFFATNEGKKTLTLSILFFILNKVHTFHVYIHKCSDSCGCACVSVSEWVHKWASEHMNDQ